MQVALRERLKRVQIPRTPTKSNQTLDAQTSATDVLMPAVSAQSGGIQRPIRADSEMEAGEEDGETDVPMLAGARVCERTWLAPCT